jgi:ABC-2 type transport system ATP-binding protein
MISLHAVSKRFGLKIAVSNISFETKPGEVIGFVGPNGAGKTTTMRLIVGLLSPTSGTVRVFSSDPISDRMSVLSRLGYLPENNPLPLDMTVEEYLTFIAGVKKEMHLAKIMVELHVDDVLDKRIEQLSRGYRQRVGLAAALCGNPDLLLLDEPTSGLDPIEQDVIKELITELAKKRTIIFSTHILSEIEDVANRVLVINRGTILYDGAKPKGKGAVESLFRKLIKKT